MGVIARTNRKEAREFAEKQLDHKTPSSNNNGCWCWHYGKCQIEELLDQIYGINSNGEKVELITPNKD